MRKRTSRIIAWTAAASCLAAGCGSSAVEPLPVARNPTVSFAERHDASPPIWLLQQVPIEPGRGEEEHPEERFPKVPLSRPSSSQTDPARQFLSSTSRTPAPVSSFEGLGYGLIGTVIKIGWATPPDTNGAVGPNHYLQAVNAGLAIFDKSGKVLYGPVQMKTLFSGFGGPCEQLNNGDPVVLYDRLADRWLISQLGGGTQVNWECLAISRTGDPTAGYYRYAFHYHSDIDYPQIGVWPDAYYVTYNVSPILACALDRSKLLAGELAGQQCLVVGQAGSPPSPADLDGSQPPPAGAPNTMVRLDNLTGDRLESFQFHVDWADPSRTTLSGPATISGVAPMSLSSWIAQPNTTQGLHPNTGQLRRLGYRNFGDHESLVSALTVAAGTASGVRWFEFRLDANRNPVVFQQGTYAPDPAFRWLGSAAMDQAGGIGLGFSLSSSSIFPSLRVTGRNAADPLGTMTLPEGNVADGAGSQQVTYRWGDYSSMTIDPVDDCTFWFTSEYLDVVGQVQTRIASFKLDGCPPFDFQLETPPGPLTLQPGGTATLWIQSKLNAGAPQQLALAVSGLPQGVTAVLDPPAIMAGDSSVLTLSAAASAPATKSATLTIHASTGLLARNAPLQIAVAAAPPPFDFQLQTTANTQKLLPGATATLQLESKVISGAPQRLTLSASGLPQGVTAIFSPSEILAGESASVTLSAASGAPEAAAALTIAAAATAISRRVQVEIAVAAPQVTLVLEPASATVSAGRSVLVTLQSRSPSTVPLELSASGLPAGVTLVFAPPVVPAGSSSIMTIVVSPDAAAASAGCTVRARFGTASRELVLPLTVLATPSASWLSPAAGSTLSGTATLTAAAAVSPGTRLQSIEFFVDGSPAGKSTFSPASFSWDTTLASNGPHQLSASVSDLAGNTASTNAVEVVVHNEKAALPPAQHGCGSTQVGPLGGLLAMVWWLNRRRRDSIRA